MNEYNYSSIAIPIHVTILVEIVVCIQFRYDYLYCDVSFWICQNIACENEAEFCCYDILLHLHDGNVLK